MSYGWEGFKPAPIEEFHAEAMKRFHEIKIGKRPGFCDGIKVNTILAEFKMKIKKEYGISSDPIPIEKGGDV